jgi:hypothetical protein
MIRTLALLLVLIIPAAHGADWVRLSHIRGEDQYFYDRSKLVIDGDELTYWKKVVFKTPQPIKGQRAAWSLMRERIHCSQHTLRLISYLYYNADGATIDYVPDAEKEGTPIIPDTIGDAFERYMCDLVEAKHAAEPKPMPPTPCTPERPGSPAPTGSSPQAPAPPAPTPAPAAAPSPSAP